MAGSVDSQWRLDDNADWSASGPVTRAVRGANFLWCYFAFSLTH